MIRIDHVTFSYGEENENAGGVHDINLTVEDGQCVVLCGESGCGKTTITRLINGLIPHYYEGKMNGEVWVNGAKVSEQPLYDISLKVGWQRISKSALSIFQCGHDQRNDIRAVKISAQPEQSIVRDRCKACSCTARSCSLEKLMGRNIFHLSGGEKQKIACGPAVSIMEPDVHVLWMSHHPTLMLPLSLDFRAATTCILEVAGKNNYSVRTSAVLSVAASCGSFYLYLTDGEGGR